jgi:hypothetical protein
MERFIAAGMGIFADGVSILEACRCGIQGGNHENACFGN